MYKINDIIVVTGNHGYGHTYVIGESYRVVTCNVNNQTLTAACLKTGTVGNTLKFSEIRRGKKTKAEINEEIEVKNTEIFALETQLAYMEEVGVEEYSDQEFNIYLTLKILDAAEVSRADKVQQIKKLLEIA